ncbi:hypothetical protein KGY73_03630 [bacterium]|nr:hypothetical protein [bacterium]
MVLRRLISTDGKSEKRKIIPIFGFSLFVFLLIGLGPIACQKKAEEGSQEKAEVEKNVREFEGNVKVAVGKFMFVPSLQGFDILVQGQINSGEELTSLEGKEVRGKGKFSPDKPSILVAETIEVKNETGEWVETYTKGEKEVGYGNYLSLSERENYPPLENIVYNEKRTWEDVEKGKVFGKLKKTTETQDEKEVTSYSIVVLDEEGNEKGKVIVDNFTDYGLYYVKKLGLFNKMWFYLNDIGETVDWSVRRQTEEMFHAECVFAGLY